MLSNEEYINKVVDEFYAKAINDIFIGYHFRKIRSSQSTNSLKSTLDQFSHHLPRIKEFWKIQLINGHKSSEKNFDLVKIHQLLKIRKGELNRWIVLFQETLNEQDYHQLKQKWMDRITQFQSIFLVKIFGG